MIRQIFILFIFLTSNAFSGSALDSYSSSDSIVFSDGTEFPAMTNNSNQFHRVTQLQDGGTCHIFAAVALIEAACFRAIGEKIDISEMYFINRHFSAQLDDLVYYDLNKKRDNGLITYLDGGFSWKTISRASNGSICTERELPMDDTFINDLRKIVQEGEKKYASLSCSYTTPENYEPKSFQEISGLPPEQKKLAILEMSLRSVDLWIKDYKKINPFSRFLARDVYKKNLQQREQYLEEIKALQKSVKSVTKDQLCHALNDQMVCSFPVSSRKAQSGGYYAKTSDPKLRRCLGSGLEARKEEFSYKKALGLLSRGIPFLCSGKFNFGEGDNSDGYHISTFVGYRYNEEMPNNIEWKLRDSNMRFPSWGWGGSNCRFIIYIE